MHNRLSGIRAMVRRCSTTLLALLLACSWVAAHPTAPPGQAADPPTHRPSPQEMTAYAALLGQPPVLIVDLGEQAEVAILATPSGRQQLVYVDWYIKFHRFMPGLLEASVRISRIRLVGDLVAFDVEEPDTTLDYLWEPESSGPPYWRRVRKGTGEITHSPHVGQHRVAEFYLRDALAPRKAEAAQALRQAMKSEELVYLDSTVLVLAAPGGSRNAVFRWAGDRWVAAGEVSGAVNHHGVADLNGDGMVEMLAGDSTFENRCSQSWSALYTWTADRAQVVPAPIRATSTTHLAGGCDQRPPACFREESLTWNVSAQPGPVIELKGTQDTTGPGCAPQGQTGTRKTYVQRYRWDAAKGAFALLAP